MIYKKQLLCPICTNDKGLKIRRDTEIKNFPLFCPMCKKETLINVEQFKISVLKNPDTKIPKNYILKIHI